MNSCLYRTVSRWNIQRWSANASLPIRTGGDRTVSDAFSKLDHFPIYLRATAQYLGSAALSGIVDPRSTFFEEGLLVVAKILLCCISPFSFVSWVLCQQT
ncbi:uncharacterized protein BDW70DRAFT_130419 [Aspergillus foveolatus]|uniref:uncharacterized protein n=1 Tax=Aspergillus foveolatus TaxID=210207 RepID=UPI003CCD3C20